MKAPGSLTSHSASMSAAAMGSTAAAISSAAVFCLALTDLNMFSRARSNCVSP